MFPFCYIKASAHATEIRAVSQSYQQAVSAAVSAMKSSVILVIIICLYFAQLVVGKNNTFLEKEKYHLEVVYRVEDREKFEKLAGLGSSTKKPPKKFRKL